MADGTGAGGVVGVVALEDVGKEEELHHQEYERELDEDECPQASPDGHRAESLDIKSHYAPQQVHLSA